MVFLFFHHFGFGLLIPAARVVISRELENSILRGSRGDEALTVF
jgi:hypothetical protein